MTNKKSIFYCPFDGILLLEKPFGFIYCEKCKRWFIPSENHNNCLILQEIWKDEDTK